MVVARNWTDLFDRSRDYRQYRADFIQPASSGMRACTGGFFQLGRLIRWAKLAPLLSASVPATLIGALIVLDASLYRIVTGVVLLIAAAVMILRRAGDDESPPRLPLPESIAIGGAVGFVSGLTGVGGGVFLAPVMIALRWATPKETSALSAPFILVNSAVGLAGATMVGQHPAPHTLVYGAAAVIGAVIGASLGLRWLSQNLTRYVLAAILAAAGLQLLFLA
jgi:hypothetical protein